MRAQPRHLVLVVVGLAACDGGKSGDGLTVTDLVKGGCGADELSGLSSPDSGDTAEPESLTVTAAGAGAIQVLHLNVQDSCCLDHEVKTAVSGTDLTVTYESSGDPCDCVCGYDYSYSVSGLEAGDWTVTAGDSSATVTVE